MNLRNTLETTGFVTMLAIAAPAFAFAQGATPVTPGAGTDSQQTTQSQGTTQHMSESAVKSVLQEQGYQNISDLKQSGNNYTANATRYGKEVKDIKIDAMTGRVENQKKLSEHQVKNMLKNKGYTDISDVEHNGHEFTAKAKQNGNEMKLKIDDHTGMIMPEQAQR